MTLTSRITLLLIPAFCCNLATAAAEPQVVLVWPEGSPALANVPTGEQEKVVERSKTPEAKHDRSVNHVGVPTITLYSPAKDRNTGCAVIVCPGGAYAALAIDKEGYDVARWLNTIGVTGVVLKYRLPRPDLTPADAEPWPIADGRQAIRLVRSRAGEWGIDPKRVGVMGFSAGGHLASTLATHFDDATRPDFVVLAYPVVSLSPALGHAGSRQNLLGKGASAEQIETYSNDLHVTRQTPPAFLVHAKDDKVKCENSVAFYDACRKAGVPAELHLYDTGGHGFGLGVNGGEVATWPARLEKWLGTQHFTDAAQARP